MAVSHRQRELRSLLGLLGEAEGLRHPGQDVDQLRHGLLCATYAEADGADRDLVVVALVHDLAKPLTEVHHGEAMAAMLAGKVRPELCSLLRCHGDYVGDLNWGRPHARRILVSDDVHTLACRFAAWDHAALCPKAHKPLSHFLDDLRAVVLGGQP